MLKKIISLLLSVVVAMSIVTTAFAVEQTSQKTMSTFELISQLNAIDFGKEITFTPLPHAKSNANELHHFDSVKEAEIYLKELLATRNENIVPEKLLGGQGSRSLTKATRGGYYNSTVWWWGGGNTSLLSVTNAEITFYYNNGVVSNITVNDSYMTGIVGASWTHRRGSGTPQGGTNAKFSVTGTWLIGLDVFGLPIGASFDETLNSPVIDLWP